MSGALFMQSAKVQGKAAHILILLTRSATRVAGAAYAKALESIDAVPVSMPLSEVYTSLQRGVVDAAMGVDISFRAKKLYDVAKYQINPGAFQFDLSMIMNKVSFDRLSEEQKKVVWDTAELYRHDYSVSQVLGGGYMHMRDILEENYNVAQIYLSESEQAKMKKAMWGPTVKWWKKRVGSELADKTLKAIEDSKNWRKTKYGYLELYPLNCKTCADFISVMEPFVGGVW